MSKLPICIHTILIAVEIALAFYVWHNGFLFNGYIQEEAGKSWWTLLGPYATIVTAIVGGSIAWQTYNKGHKQRQEQFEQDAKKKQEYFERQSLDAQFTDILNRLSNKDSLVIRANAALRLADIARQSVPGGPNALTSENYSFFGRASAQLSAALHMEEEQKVRDEVIRGLGSLNQFACQGSQELLYVLIADLAYANRSAKKAFLNALAEFRCLKDYESEDYLSKLANFASVCGEKTVTRICFQSLTELPECSDAVVIHKALRDSQGEEESKRQDNLLWARMQSVAAKLSDSRDALAYALKALSAPDQVPKNTDELRSWHRSSPIVLTWCFLAGADLSDACLPGALLNETQLQGVIFDRADLRKASLFKSQLQKARFVSSEVGKGGQLQAATLDHANLQSAVFINANLSGAILFASNLKEALINSTALNGAFLQYAQAQGTSFTNSTFDDAIIGGLQILSDGVNENAIKQLWFGTNWWAANFNNAPRYELGIEDDDLWNALDNAMPGQAPAYSKISMVEMDADNKPISPEA